MTLPAAENVAPETLAEVPRHQCGYDVRAHAADGVCPECAASVAESRRVAAIPVRPKWGESDPRWRRRMLAGVWLLVMVPLVDVVSAFGWADGVPVPFWYMPELAGQTLRDTMIFWYGFYQVIVMCMGLGLLFSNERGRRANWWDWTRRWGLLGCCLMLILMVVDVLFIVALVTIGVGALLMSISAAYQPGVTPMVVEVGQLYVRYGPNPGNAAFFMGIAVSSLTVMLACVPLFNALRSTLSKHDGWVARIPPGFLAVMGAVNITTAVGYLVGLVVVARFDDLKGFYFATQEPARELARWLGGGGIFRLITLNTLVELAKWGAVLAMAVWLTVAQFLAWRAGKPSAKA